MIEKILNVLVFVALVIVVCEITLIYTQRAECNVKGGVYVGSACFKNEAIIK